MCYQININLEAQSSREIRKMDLQAIKEIKESLVTLTDCQFNTLRVSAIQNASL